ncbi:uncharacterized protein Z520_10702 [Fonsecaea multimorphosa CBS 102226]|uniref:STEEP1 domain-containing protein n=1 Tax=Fonsecaea multimorphosa CBS 102226 TaxID=1442371 RepID=A0A0D2JSS3_9EURO|nr:uncharacterized protein Z520_10702 [Fonsecaea multimorphosa CBS 102226]KIX93524.1 hypothetical protein Z520_10702 [Fonsecaea multimorphosa CBS 102226]OAL18839.1 hypothetical protein AYO22_10168 [Fonsecaea multimorphosa]
MADRSPSSSIHTYHCLCTTLVLTTAHDLNSLPRRNEPVQDGALILAPPVNISRAETLEAQLSESATSVLLNVAPERRPVMIRREDGFEKRTLLRCVRCKLVLGYNLDESHFEQQEGDPRPVYLLPGGLLSTQDMVEGKQPETPLWAEQK